jgi:outer membrane protein assembly factor BamB
MTDISKIINKKRGRMIYIKLFIGLVISSVISNIHAQESGTVKWDYWIPTSWSWTGSPAIGSDGTIYIGSLDGYLYAIRSSGTEKWRFRTGGQVWTSPAIGLDGTIYVGSSDSLLYAIGYDGKKKWIFKAGQFWKEPTLGPNGRIYSGSSDGFFYALNTKGIQEWKFEGGFYSAVSTDGVIYVTSVSGITALDLDGTIEWVVPLENGGWNCPAIGMNGTVYVVTANMLYAIGPEGTVLWNFDLIYYSDASPVIGKDGTIYIGTSEIGPGNPDGYFDIFWAITPEGEEVYSFEVEGQLIGSATVGEDSTVYIADQLNLYAYSADLITEKWHMPISDPLTSGSPAISKDGTLYITMTDGHLNAIHCSSHGLADSGWPRLHHDNANSGDASRIETNGVAVPGANPCLYPLGLNYPNPFNAVTTVQYGIPFDSDVILRIFDATGRNAGILLQGKQPEGFHRIRLNGQNFSSGVYFYQLVVNGYPIMTRKLLLIR